jgi:hypothetical protein
MNRAQRFAGIGGHHSNRPQTVEWLTPPAVLAALGGAASFDLDPATPDVQPWPTAKARYTKADDGLALPWFGRVWLNPPYTNGIIGRWLEKLASHGCGTTIIFARTETDAFFRHVWERAHALLFLRGRLNFHYPSGDRAAANSGAPTVLCAYGDGDADVLAACGLNGQFVPLIFPRFVLVEALADVTWAQLVGETIRAMEGPVRVADIWQLIKDHPKARGKENARAKVRQVLQLGAGVSVGRDQWVPA